MKTYLVRNYGGKRRIKLDSVKAEVRLEYDRVYITQDEDIAKALAGEKQVYVVRRNSSQNANLPQLPTFRKNRFNVLEPIGNPVPEHMLSGNLGEDTPVLPPPEPKVREVEPTHESISEEKLTENLGGNVPSPIVRGKKVIGVAKCVRHMLLANEKTQYIYATLIPAYVKAGKSSEEAMRILDNHIETQRKKLDKE